MAVPDLGLGTVPTLTASMIIYGLVQCLGLGTHKEVGRTNLGLSLGLDLSRGE